LGSNSLNTPALATTDFRVLKYFRFGGVKRLDVVAEFFNPFNSANVSEINPVFGSGLTQDLGNRLPEPARAKSSSLWMLFGFRVLRMACNSCY
jgi:hypothetical protein